MVVDVTSTAQLTALETGGTAKDPDDDDWTGALEFRVDHRQEGVDDADEWNTGATATVAASG